MAKLHLDGGRTKAMDRALPLPPQPSAEGGGPRPSPPAAGEFVLQGPVAREWGAAQKEARGLPAGPRLTPAHKRLPGGVTQMRGQEGRGQGGRQDRKVSRCWGKQMGPSCRHRCTDWGFRTRVQHGPGLWPSTQQTTDHSDSPLVGLSVLGVSILAGDLCLPVPGGEGLGGTPGHAT